MSNLIQHLPKFIAEQAARLEEVGIDSARAEIEWILCHVLEVERLDLYLHGTQLLNDERLRRIDRIVEERRTRKPLQFILGEAFFYGRRFMVTPDVMAPTPETEGLVERAVGFVRHAKLKQPHILDIGIGSGVIGLTLALEIPDARIVAVDICAKALKVAGHNGDLHAVTEQVDFRQSDNFSAVGASERFDLILANPPYIAEPDYADLEPEIHADPKIAMTSGPEGMDNIKAILRDAPNHLAPRGRIMFEIGYDQAEKVAALTSDDPRYSSIDIIKDLNDIDRIVILACDV